MSFEDFLSDTSYGDVTFERHVQYSSDKVPEYLVTNWEFSDELSGLWSASAYYVSKNDAGNYDWSTWSQNNNYRYYDDLVNYAQERDSFDISTLPTVIATTNIATHDRAGNFISYDRDFGYFELARVNEVVGDQIVGASIHTNIFVVEEFDTSKSITGNAFEDYLYVPGDLSDYSIVSSNDVTTLSSNGHNIKISQVENLGFADGVFQIANLDLHDISGVFDLDQSPNEVSEDASVGTIVGITAFAEDLDAGDIVTYSLTDDAGGLFSH